MKIGNIFQIIDTSTGRSYIGRSTRTDSYIKRLFKENFNPRDYRVKILFTSIGDEKQVRDELQVQYKRFLKQYDSSLNDLKREKPQLKQEKVDKRIGKPSPYSKKVIKVDEDGKPRAIFGSVSEASRITGCNKSLISRVCNNQMKYVIGKNDERYMFQWFNKIGIE